MGSWEGRCFVCDIKQFIRHQCEFCAREICKQCRTDHYYECTTDNAYDTSSDSESK